MYSSKIYVDGKNYELREFRILLIQLTEDNYKKMTIFMKGLALLGQIFVRVENNLTING